MKRINPTFLKIYSFFLVFLLAVSIGRGFLSLWFKQNGFTYPQIAAYFFIKLLLPSLILLFVKKFSTVKSFSLALISEIILMLGVSRFFHPWQIFLVGFPSGITVVFFYVTYNTLHFKNTPKDRRAFSSSLFTLAGPFLGIVLPPLVGFLAQKWGFPSIFLTAIFILLIAFYLIRLLPKIEFECQLGQILNKTRRINFLLIIEGIKDTVSLAAIPLFTLFFIDRPLPYGIYFGYLAFVSAIATLILGYFSDRFKKRTVILYPVTSLAATMIILLAFSQSLTWWAIITGVLGFILTINGTFVTTLVLDQVHREDEAMISREFLVGVGRGIGTSLIIASLALYNSPKLALILIGSLYFLFPLIVRFKKIYPNPTHPPHPTP